MTAQFNIPSTIITGAGASTELVPQLARLGARRVLLVTDAFMVSSGLAARFQSAMLDAGLHVATFDGVQPDPTDANVGEGARRFAEEKCDAIVALGGGSPMDAAKAISILATNGEPLSRFQGYHRVERAGVPLIVIPTTAGTGSEVTKVAVITDTKRDVKMMMLDRYLLPTVALVDYELTFSMPPALTAHVGVDTLTHGIEAYVSRKATALTDPLALQCIRLVTDHLETAWREPHNPAAREGMMLAATLGGMAFANSSVALVHGMSRPIGAVFHVPHGLSNAVLLPTVTRFSLAGALKRYADVARVMRLATSADSDTAAGERLVTGLAALNTRLEVPRLGACPGVERARFEEVKDKMAADAMASGSPQNNPVVPTAQQIVELYDEAFECFLAD
jgi:alcohol dehydrogenase